MYRTVTHDIEVTVTPRFLPERSSHEKNYFFWSYTVEINNRKPGNRAAQDPPLADYRDVRAV